MSLNHGREQLAIPGPSVIPDRVLAAMHRPSPNIYEGELIDLTASLYPDLKAVARTAHSAAIYISNGHGAWEAALRNTLVEGDGILVLATGRFADGWADLAESLGIDCTRIDFGMQGQADPAKLEEALQADNEKRYKAVLVVQTDTASSVRNDIPALRQAIDTAGHDALFMVDCIASLGCDCYEMDQWGVDVTVAACQKGLMTPAGIAFLFFNEKAATARSRARPGLYWDWHPRANPEIYYQQFGGTAPTQHLYGLRAALDMIVHEEGLENVWNRHETLAQAYWAAVDAWGADGKICHNIADRQKRSCAVSTIATAPEDAARLRKWTEKEAGITLGIGLGFGTPGSPGYNRRFRIGHMGHQNIPMTFGVIGAIDTALKALGIDHGDGALEAAAKVMAANTTAKE